MNWSKYQTDVFDFMAGDNGNLVVNAVAGSGKSTVIHESVSRIPFEQSVLVVAFNRHIRDPLKDRFAANANVTVDTLNGFGNKLFGWHKVKKDKTLDVLYFDILQKPTDDATKKLYYKVRHRFAKIIGLLKANLLFQPSADQVFAVMLEHDIEVPKDVDPQHFYDLLMQTYKACLLKTKVIDFDDQIALPIYHGFEFPQYDWVLGDEGQDFTQAQIEQIKRATGARCAVVGDPRQSIYAFRGASKTAIPDIIRDMHATELPLSICYRCAKAVVRHAQRIVPHIEYHDDAIDGLDTSVSAAEYRRIVGEGDIVLCRTTAPLVEECLRLIRNSQKASIKGREIGDDLVDMIDWPDGTTVEEFDGELAAAVHTKMEGLERAKKPDLAANISDKYDTIKCFYASCRTAGEIKVAIATMFDDNTTDGVRLMTGHKAKGLESRRVHVLHPELLPHPKSTDLEQEANLEYVMITRAKEELYYVHDSEGSQSVA